MIMKAEHVVCNDVNTFVRESDQVKLLVLHFEEVSITIAAHEENFKFIDHCITKGEEEDFHFLPHKVLWFIINLVDKMKWKVNHCMITYLDEEKYYYGEIVFDTPQGKVRIPMSPCDLLPCSLYFQVETRMPIELYQDRMIASIGYKNDSIDLQVNSINLQHLLEDAIEDQDFELAAEIRDQINLKITNQWKKYCIWTIWYMIFLYLQTMKRRPTFFCPINLD